MAEQDRRALAAEVIELGEQLFAFALEGRAGLQVGEEAVVEAFPLDEIQVASEEFFVALRLLLGME